MLNMCIKWSWLTVEPYSLDSRPCNAKVSTVTGRDRQENVIFCPPEELEAFAHSLLDFAKTLRVK